MGKTLDITSLVTPFTKVVSDITEF